MTRKSNRDAICRERIGCPAPRRSSKCWRVRQPRPRVVPKGRHPREKSSAGDRGKNIPECRALYHKSNRHRDLWRSSTDHAGCNLFPPPAPAEMTPQVLTIVSRASRNMTLFLSCRNDTRPDSLTGHDFFRGGFPASSMTHSSPPGITLTSRSFRSFHKKQGESPDTYFLGTNIRFFG